MPMLWQELVVSFWCECYLWFYPAKKQIKAELYKRQYTITNTAAVTQQPFHERFGCIAHALCLTINEGKKEKGGKLLRWSKAR